MINALQQNKTKTKAITKKVYIKSEKRLNLSIIELHVFKWISFHREKNMVYC